jgi:hypothetical protein
MQLVIDYDTPAVHGSDSSTKVKVPVVQFTVVAGIFSMA